MPTSDATIIRAATVADAAAVAVCTRAAYAKHVARLGREPKPMTADYGRIIAESRVWVAECGATCCGVLVLDLHPDHALIYSIAVHPRRQGHGLGRRLLALAEAETRRRGRRELRLYTNAKMTENIAFYTWLGFRETERRPHQDHADFILVFMCKDVVAERAGGKDK